MKSWSPHYFYAVSFLPTHAALCNICKLIYNSYHKFNAPKYNYPFQQTENSVFALSPCSYFPFAAKMIERKLIFLRYRLCSLLHITVLTFWAVKCSYILNQVFTTAILALLNGSTMTPSRTPIIPTFIESDQFIKRRIWDSHGGEYEDGCQPSSFFIKRFKGKASHKNAMKNVQS
jgi:hypothetical protein